MPNDTQKLAHSVAEFAKLSGVCRSLLYLAIKSGHLKIRKAGRRTLILREEGQAWLADLPSASSRASSNSTKP
jgi:hypothetical protein